MDKFVLFIFNVFINSFLTFFTAVLLVEGVIFLFRIRMGRCASLLRMIPILKLLFDLFLYDFSRWSFLQGVDPLLCKEGSRALTVAAAYVESLFLFKARIELNVLGNMTFTIADVFGRFLNPILLKTFSISLLLLSFGFVARKIALYRMFTKKLQLNKPLKRFYNTSIRKALQKNGTQIVASDSISGSPFVAGLVKPIIYIPERLLGVLSKKEFEAVLAHEVEHIRHRDTLMRFVLQLVGSLFWWVPTAWLRKRIEEGQEIACDARCSNYRVQSVDLASAICKSVKRQVATEWGFANYLVKRVLEKRVHFLLEDRSKGFTKMTFVFSGIALWVALSMVFLGRFWIF